MPTLRRLIPLLAALPLACTTSPGTTTPARHRQRGHHRGARQPRGLDPRDRPRGHPRHPRLARADQQHRPRTRQQHRPRARQQHRPRARQQHRPRHPRRDVRHHRRADTDRCLLRLHAREVPRPVSRHLGRGPRGLRGHVRRRGRGRPERRHAGHHGQLARVSPAPLRPRRGRARRLRQRPRRRRLHLKPPLRPAPARQPVAATSGRTFDSVQA
jgi:hypothetical protein